MKEKIKLNLNTIQNMCFDISEKGEYIANYNYTGATESIMVMIRINNTSDVQFHRVIHLQEKLPIEKLQNLIKDLKKYL